MNEVKTKKRWEADTWTTELQSKFQQVKDLFTDPAGACRAHPMALGEPGALEFILITDYSKEAVGRRCNLPPGTTRDHPVHWSKKKGVEVTR